MNLASSALQRLADEIQAKTGVVDNFYQMHLDLGQECVVAPLSRSETKAIVTLLQRACTVRCFKPQHCFGNAQTLTGLDSSKFLTYYEGFVTAKSAPDHIVHHAWVTIGLKVIDVTFRAAKKVGNPLPSYDYFGVAIPRGMIFERVLRTREHRAVLEDSTLLRKYFLRNTRGV